MYIFGASGHGKVIASTLIANNESIKGFIDDHPKSDKLMGLPVVHSNEFERIDSEVICIGVGHNLTRKSISERIKSTFLSVIHKSAIICQTVKIGNGTVIFANAVVNAETSIGSHVIINTGAIIEHDCMVENFVHISPNAAIAGGVIIGEGTHIGIGACVIPGVTIGEWAVIGAGAVVIKDVPDGAVVVGNPARVIKVL